MPEREMAKPSLLLTINTLIVLAMTAVFVAGAIPLIVFAGDAGPFAFLGAVAFTPPVIAFGIVVFRSVFGRSKNATIVSTILYFLAAAFVLFGVAANIGESLLEDAESDWRLLLIFGGIGFAIALYAILCGVLSIGWYRRLNTANQHMQH